VATYADVQALILNDLHRSDLTAEVQTAMSNAITRLQMDRFWFNETQYSFVATLTAFYEVDTYLPNTLAVDTVRAYSNGSPVALRREHWDTLADLDEVLCTGLPSSWAVHHEMLRLYPTPNQTTTIEVSALKQLSVTAWCAYAPMLVRAAAEVEVYGMVTHDTQGAARAAEFARIEKEALLRRSPSRMGSGEVRGYL
jgi:hypothetical protein